MNGLERLKHSATLRVGVSVWTVACCLLLAQPTSAQYGTPELAPGEPIDVSFAEPFSVSQIYTALGRAFDVSIVTAPDLREQVASFVATDVSLEEALERLGDQLGHFYVVRGESEVLVANDTPQNRRRYEPQVVATFALQHLDPSTTMNALRAIFDVRKVSMDERLGSLTVRDVAAKMQHIERWLEREDRPTPEIAVELELWRLRRLPPSARLGRSVASETLRRVLEENGDSVTRSTLSLRDRGVARTRFGGRVMVAGESSAVQSVKEGLGLDVRGSVHEGGEIVRLRVQLDGSCTISTTVEGLPRQRSRSLETELSVERGHGVLLSEVLPSEAGVGCGIESGSPEPTAQGAHYVLLLTPQISRSAERPEGVVGWFVGTEYSVEPPRE